MEFFNKIKIYVKLQKTNKIIDKWRPPCLSELTPIIFEI